MTDLPDLPISRHIWATRYRAGEAETNIEATRARVARAVAQVEPRNRKYWQERFENLLADFRFIPAGRILAGAGIDRQVTLFNCFVMGTIGDSLPEIFHHLGEGALTLQQGGGIGCDFSPLRPKGWTADRSGTTASGPVSFLHVWNAMCEAMQSAGNRRGALMATLRCDHPDIEVFIDAKRRPEVLSQCNLSVLVTDEFVQAAREGLDWPLKFPTGTGRGRAKAGSIPARRLWDKIIDTAVETAEPGMLFVDTINRENNLAYRETISATNPCGEVPLPPYGACNLGSINLTRFVRAPFSQKAVMDFEGIAVTVAEAVRLLDNVIDLSGFPLAIQGRAARSTRRVGLGLTGLADALIMLGLDYGADEARSIACGILQVMRDSAYRASIELAGEKGCFPAFRAGPYLTSPFVQRLPHDIRRAIGRDGIRNSHLLAIAPTGTISLLAGNVSSGIEPVHAARYRRRVRTGEEFTTFEVEDAACRAWRLGTGDDGPPPAMVATGRVSAAAQIEMLAVLQPLVDNAISKTVRLAGDLDNEQLSELFHYAHRKGLKGLTVYAPGGLRGAVLGGTPTCTGTGECL